MSALLLLKFCHVALLQCSVQRTPLRGVLAKKGAVHWQRDQAGGARTVMTISQASQLPANNRRTSPSTYLLAAVTSSCTVHTYDLAFLAADKLQVMTPCLCAQVQPPQLQLPCICKDSIDR